MAELAVNHSQAPHFEASGLQTPSTEQNNIEAAETYSQHLMPTEESFDPAKSTGTELLDKGFGQHGCSHYRRRCRIRAPCCDEIFDCLSTLTRNLDMMFRGIRLNRSFVHSVALNKRFDKFVLTAVYVWEDTSVEVATYMMMIHLRNSITVMGAASAGCCFSILLKDDHPCVEGAMHHDCPVCFEYLFETRNDVSVMRCGHTMHRSCLDEMKEHSQYACPLCCKSVCDMSKVWERLDMEVAATPMPENYRNKMVRILCNDCGLPSEVKYHIIGQKCPNCKSYNTRLR
ncbi:hypothetical protein RJ639_025356 [Escallonia herrerae]|uniref:RING-type domain-containing protein n=1 Tax=Escallonia herrerae TaxID=1293975 RepID=A0AA88RW51_9ASTE|nr:hypothetical protein RJ639_025356 [Escallonia herrerae]